MAFRPRSRRTPEPDESTTSAGHDVLVGAVADQLPHSVWVIAGGIFAMVTSEFMAAGLLPEISNDVGVSIGAASMLISGFAAGQVLGPWLVGIPLSRFGPRAVLPGLLAMFALAQTIGVISLAP